MSKNYIDVRKTKVAENFNNKCQLMGIDTDTQVENLNRIYESKLSFKKDRNLYGEEVIRICWMNPEIRILELPEVENLEIGYVMGWMKDNNITTIKLPKTVKSVEWSDFSQFNKLNSLWIWDTTEIKGEKSWMSSIKMLVVQKINGEKSEVYRV